MPTSATSIRRPFGWARVAIGAFMAARPAAVSKLWWGDEPSATSATTTAILRSMGARDAVIGAGTALADDRRSVGWLRAGIVADLADLVAAALGGDELPSSRRAATVAFAAAGALTGALIARAAR